ncbi:PrgH/EprH family type III secretion apparatus protein [Pseudomonas chlororaphis]|uniref:PrgH/EprH family type III secretion apparatus protein n=1 Tax=Pseudomonas chlororaphis TaxID=587753 RepID=UPI0030D45903
MQESPAMQCVLRVFNGPLQGCEFALTQMRTLFIVGGGANFCESDQPLTVPEDAIYVPLESGGCNFEVLIGDVSDKACIVRMLDGAEVVERSLPFQVLEAVGGLRIAVRPVEDAWRDELLAPVPSLSSGKRLTRVPGSCLQRILIGCSIMLVLGLSVFAFCTWRPSPVSSVEALIAGASTGMTVLNGGDRAVYVFADSERDAGWGRQILVRNGYAATQVLTTYGERKRLEDVLASVAPQLAYHQLDLRDPAVPRLVVSRQRTLLTPELQVHLEKALRVAAPYVRQLEVVTRDDSELLELAKQGLQNLALPFALNEHAGGVTFTIEGNLEDGELQALREFFTDFDRQWGEHYVHFAIELKDDWLKGKSFQYGPQGYIKMTPSSWYFPKPL